MKRYTLSLLAITFAALVLIGVGNAVVDPYGILGSPTIAGLTDQKTERFGSGARIPKSLALARDDFDVVLLGSSRVMVGLDPGSPAFEGRNVFNAALPGTNASEMLHVADFVLREQPPGHLIIGLDFEMFGPRQSPNHDFALSAFSGRDSEYIAWRHLFSWSTLLHSTATVSDNLNGMLSSDLSNGHSDRVRRLPTSFNSHRASINYLRNNFLRRDHDYVESIAAEGAMVRLAQSLEAYCDAGWSVSVFTTPVHTLQLMAIDQQGHWTQFEQYKRDIGSIIESSDCATGWDFTVVDETTTEPIPALDAPGLMDRYIEISHFRPVVGAEIIDQLFGESGELGFGVAFQSSAALEIHLATQRRALAGFQTEHPELVELINRLQSETSSASNERE